MERALESNAVPGHVRLLVLAIELLKGDESSGQMAKEYRGSTEDHRGSLKSQK